MLGLAVLTLILWRGEQTHAGHLFVPNYDDGIVGVYNASDRSAINDHVINFAGGSVDIALDNSGILYVASYAGVVGKFNASDGSAVDANFITGLSGPSRRGIGQ